MELKEQSFFFNIISFWNKNKIAFNNLAFFEMLLTFTVVDAFVQNDGMNILC
jgi:hypothetical protein